MKITMAGIALTLAFPLSAALADPGIAWNASVRLQTTDFRAAPAPEFEGQAAQSAVILGFTPKFTESGELRYSIRCEFSPALSWMSVDEAGLLSHEQAHFDLAESYARKLQHEIQASLRAEGSETSAQELNQIYDWIRLEHRQAQIDYDQQTRHGTRARKQRRWLRRIRRDLEKHVDDANYPRP